MVVHLAHLCHICVCCSTVWIGCLAPRSEGKTQFWHQSMEIPPLWCLISSVSLSQRPEASVCCFRVTEWLFLRLWQVKKRTTWWKLNVNQMTQESQASLSAVTENTWMFWLQSELFIREARRNKCCKKCCLCKYKLKLEEVIVIPNF